MATDQVYDDPNGMPMADGKNIHMDIGRGQLANRVLTVGSQSRAEKIAAFLDAEPAPFNHTSSRGFTTITGRYKGVDVSVVAIGMGLPMMDFFVREGKAVVDGPMVIVRYGTCGGLARDTQPGDVIVATEGSALIQRNPDAFFPDADEQPYFISRVCPADPEISATVTEKLQAAFKAADIASAVRTGLNITADGFYATQGRRDPNFDDRNADLIEKVMERFPSASSMEMETFQLLHLAACSKGQIRAAAAAIALANRHTRTVVSENLVHQLEVVGGEAVLDAICTVSLGEQISG